MCGTAGSTACVPQRRSAPRPIPDQTSARPHHLHQALVLRPREAVAAICALQRPRDDAGELLLHQGTRPAAGVLLLRPCRGEDGAPLLLYPLEALLAKLRGQGKELGLVGHAESQPPRTS